ncbi:MAG TPA: DUF4386 domain-containing protein [Chitinophagaceae bacterium]|nr:DUF4386 domain-containing protein [Chitinophagaceae bacterium]
MKKQKITGWLLISGAAGVFIPYTILSIIFNYPDVLRQEPGSILTQFHHGGNGLIGTWFAFAILGLPLLPAYQLIGQQAEKHSIWAKTATMLGVAGLIVQMIGLLRWTFVVPVLSEQYVNTTDPAIKAAAISSFSTLHQFAGVLLGEHLGQLFTIIWTIMISLILMKAKFFSRWMGWLGIISSLIYLLAQADLFATVIPGFPVWEMAGFLGSTLWLIWLIITGILMIRKKTGFE